MITNSLLTRSHIRHLLNDRGQWDLLWKNEIGVLWRGVNLPGGRVLAWEYIANGIERFFVYTPVDGIRQMSYTECCHYIRATVFTEVKYGNDEWSEDTDTIIRDWRRAKKEARQREKDKG